MALTHSLPATRVPSIPTATRLTNTHTTTNTQGTVTQGVLQQYRLANNSRLNMQQGQRLAGAMIKAGSSAAGAAGARETLQQVMASTSFGSQQFRQVPGSAYGQVGLRHLCPRHVADR